MAFISYYFHWSNSEVAALEHSARRRWCSEISSINTALTPSEKQNKKEKSLRDINFSPRM
ncbi:MAG: hypothetical protein FWG83_01110 [Oscillospiraceae bacterium]|nr:hypothetical protein [Oscillospiraceae bacterium]